MKCDICKKNDATIHQTIIVNGNKEEMHFCEECAQKGVVGFNKAFSMEDFFGAFLGKEVKTIEPTCKSCGMTIEQLKKTGRLGCEDCYNELRQYILPVIQNVHGRTTHVGKTPYGDFSETIEAFDKKGPTEVMDEAKTLSVELKQAIEKEDYESAAIIRDRIKVIKELEQAKGE